jgi:membrane dipeptidase|tara:strand:+ start:179 stop:1351 length:1173 start_codon:yes stop_codon:yes gene_type:complete
MIILRTITLICFLLISHLSFTEYRDKNYQARLQDVMKARKLMDKKRERDKINNLAQELAQEMIIIDTHLDTPIQLYMQQSKNGFYEDITKTSSLHFDFDRAVSGGLNVPFFVIFTPPSAEEKGTAFEMAKDLIQILEDIMNKHPSKFRLVKSPEEITNEKGVMQVVYGMENGAPIESKLSNIKVFSDMGINYITLAHSKSNHISDSSYDSNKNWGGLSPFGRKVVAEMNKQGVMIDISHVSDAAFYEVLKLTKTPVIASHSSLRHFVPGFERNVSDDMLRELAKNEGVIQICFGSEFIAEKKKYPNLIVTVKDVADHIDRVKELVGIDHVGIGSDYDGWRNFPVGLEDTSTYPNLIKELLNRNYTKEEIEKIFGGNLLRVWREVKKFSES